MRWLLAAMFVSLAVLANWLASRFVVSVPFTHLVAPAGFYAIGICLVFRDWLTQLAGWRWGVSVIPIAALASYLIAIAAEWTSLQTIAIASVVAFTVSELLEQLVFQPLRNRKLAVGVLASGMIGNFVDSFLFIWLAWSAIRFPGATHWGLFEGNFVGKAEMILVGAGLTAARRVVLPVRA